MVNGRNPSHRKVSENWKGKKAKEKVEMERGQLSSKGIMATQAKHEGEEKRSKKKGEGID